VVRVVGDAADEWSEWSVRAVAVLETLETGSRHLPACGLCAVRVALRMHVWLPPCTPLLSFNACQITFLRQITSRVSESGCLLEWAGCRAGEATD